MDVTQTTRAVVSKHLPPPSQDADAGAQRAQELSQALRAVVENYLSQNSVRSVAFLARKAQLPYSTVRRVYHGEGVPDFATVSNILAVIMDRDSFVEFLSRYFPDSVKTLERVFSEDTEEQDSHRVASYLGRRLSHHILHLCATRAGTQRERIRMMFGSVGIKELDALIAEGVIKEKDGALSFYKKSFSKLTLNTALKNFEIHTQLFDSENLGTEGALVAFLSDSVSYEGLEKIKQTGLHYIKKVLTVRDECDGPIPFYCGLMHNLHDSVQFTKQTEERTVCSR